MSPERQTELQRQIDRRFDQFSLEEVRAADSGALTFGLSFPGLSMLESQFAERYFNQKMESLRALLREAENPESEN